MYVIFGASGKVGSVTAAALRKAGKTVRAVVRDERHAQRFTAIGCEAVVADLTEPHAVRSAIKDAHAVQIVCPIPVADADPAAKMREMIDIAADALTAFPPTAVLALSDYGAELPEGTGITQLYHYLETRLKPLATRLTLLRSAEHMENWARIIPAALEKGALPSLHHPISKVFPTVATRDVGATAAQLLLDVDETGADRTRIVSVEGPQRISAIDVAQVLSDVAHRKIPALALPRDQWHAALLHAGLTENRTRLITELYDAHNAGKIDVEAERTERRFGATPLHAIVTSLLSG